MKKVIVPEETAKKIKDDILKRGVSYRKASKKYGYSITVLRRVVGEKRKSSPPRKKVPGTKKKALTLQLEQKERIKEITKVFKSGMIDVFEGIRHSVRDMIELNDELRNALPEIEESVGRVIEYIEKNTNPEKSAKMRDEIKKAYETIGNYFGKAKLRIDSRKELGNWFDRYERLLLEQQMIRHQEEIIAIFFEALYVMTDNKTYEKVRGYAVEKNRNTDEYFRVYENAVREHSANSQEEE